MGNFGRRSAMGQTSAARLYALQEERAPAQCPGTKVPTPRGCGEEQLRGRQQPVVLLHFFGRECNNYCELERHGRRAGGTEREDLHDRTALQLRTNPSLFFNYF